MLSAFVQSIIERAHLLHYGADLVSFLEVAPSLYDKDASWAFKRDLSIDNLHGTKLDAIRTHIPQIESKPPPPVRTIYNTVPHAPMASREHRPGSLLTLKWLVMPNHSGALYACPSSTSLSKTKLIRDLVKVAGELNALDANDIAQEITRLEVKLFLDIEVGFES
jgi:hypothetical protein